MEDSLKDEIEEKIAEDTVYDDLDSSSMEYGTPISGSFTRVTEDCNPGWISRNLLGNSYDWTDLWATYEGFIEDTERVLESYGEDVQTAEPYLEVAVEDNAEPISSREEAIQIDNMRNQSADLSTHEWNWLPTDNILLNINFYDGKPSVSGKAAYRQSGATLTVGDTSHVIVDDMIDIMEHWFGERKEYREEPPVYL